MDEVTAALARMEQRKPTDWAYTQRVLTKKTERVARHDPRVPGAIRGWTLLSVDGREPTEKEATRYYRKLKQQSEKADGSEDAPPVLSELIAYDSLAVERAEESGRTVFRFQPTIKGLEDVLSGSLVFHGEQQLVESLRVWNHADYKPTFSVTVTGFSLALEFGVCGADPVLTQMVSRVKGTVGFLKKVDETATVLFSDYELLAAEP